MTTSSEQVLNAALALPEEERLELVEALLASLQPRDRPPFDESWREVIGRRSAELRDGKVTPVSWDEMKRQTGSRPVEWNRLVRGRITGMEPSFWEVSQGTEHFTYQEILDSLRDRLVYVHKDAPPKGRTNKKQGDWFVEASIGDYFYLTYGNYGIYVLGQFRGACNVFSSKEGGWLDRPYRWIRSSQLANQYSGVNKWWAPNQPSTFARVPDSERPLFEKEILIPYFGIRLSDFGL